MNIYFSWWKREIRVCLKGVSVAFVLMTFDMDNGVMSTGMDAKTILEAWKRSQSGCRLDHTMK